MGNDDGMDWPDLPHRMHTVNQKRLPLGSRSIVGYQFTPAICRRPV